jgi:hypothetical protein
MVKLSVISILCGDECVLRQWRFADGWILTNGFSIMRYGDGCTDMTVMEKTWDDINGSTDRSYHAALGPIRERDPNKFSYRLEDVIVESGVVRQFYIPRPQAGRDKENHVAELVWHLK